MNIYENIYEHILERAQELYRNGSEITPEMMQPSCLSLLRLAELYEYSKKVLRDDLEGYANGHYQVWKVFTDDVRKSLTEIFNDVEYFKRLLKYENLFDDRNTKNSILKDLLESAYFFERMPTENFQTRIEYTQYFGESLVKLYKENVIDEESLKAFIESGFNTKQAAQISSVLISKQKMSFNEFLSYHSCISPFHVYSDYDLEVLKNRALWKNANSDFYTKQNLQSYMSYLLNETKRLNYDGKIFDMICKNKELFEKLLELHVLDNDFIEKNHRSIEHTVNKQKILQDRSKKRRNEERIKDIFDVILYSAFNNAKENYKKPIKNAQFAYALNLTEDQMREFEDLTKNNSAAEYILQFLYDSQMLTTLSFDQLKDYLSSSNLNKINNNKRTI